MEENNSTGLPNTNPSSAPGVPGPAASPPPISNFPTTNKPPFISEEETAPPPPPVVGGAESSVGQGSQDVSMPGAPVSSDKPTSRPADSPSSPATPSSPPLVTPPKKSKKKLIAGVVAALLLIIGLPLGYLAVQQSQELRKSASVAEPCNVCSSNVCTRVASPPQCSHTEDECSDIGNECASSATATPVATATPGTSNTCGGAGGSCVSSGTVCRNRGGNIDDGYSCSSGVCCLGGGGPGTTPTPQATPVATATPGTGGGGGSECARLSEAGTLVKSSQATGQRTLGGEACDIVATFVGRWGDRAGRRWAVERTCGTSVAESCDGNKTLDGEQANIVQTFIDTHGQNACSRWVTEHNALVNNCQTGVANQCKQVKVYKYPYTGSPVSAPYDGKLAPGDPVKFCLEVAGSGTPEININNTGWRAAGEVNPAQERCLQYDIPDDATQLSVQGRF